MSDLHFHFLFGRSVAMANHGNDTPKLHPVKTKSQLFYRPTQTNHTQTKHTVINRDNQSLYTHIVPEVVGTIGMSSASSGMDHGI